MAGKYSNSHRQMEWVKGNALGSGSFGIVNLGMNKSNGELFAVKSASSGSGFQSLENEADILKNLNSPYIVRYLGHDVSDEANGEQTFNLFMEFMAGGSLSDITNKFGGALDESVIRSYTRGILHGLAYLHRSRIVHCDLKCKNVLLGSSGDIRLADFGGAKRLNSSKPNTNSNNFWQSMCGTPLWMAPEVLRNEGLDFASDIWSLGCTVIEMATGSPWGDEVSNPMAAVYKIACSDETPQLPPNFSVEGLDFLRKCLQRNPTSRWSSEELLSHPFVYENTSGKYSSKEYAYSPTSVLDDRGWESDGSESPIAGELPARMPFLKRCTKEERQMDITAIEWVDVRSG
ncbi:mitogen-activated protein kinase kinase kinase 17-like [Magnolia sinica]|uniref:mitogen-activated protein kinase kinase kinase 17-like n=1 Tax=Magnolia sinica TaxID=86752 RepID=UPI002658A6B0|nr:mitogen-activated protein kinase kinase kinase 17-like [Magnolia sinica]